MFRRFAKPILCALSSVLAGLFSPALSSAAEAPGAKGGALTARTNDGRKHFTLAAEATWQLDVKERFDASALVLQNGKLLTINDRDGVVYEMKLHTNAVAELKRLDIFSRAALSKVARRKAARYDLEGITVDDAGNLYVSEETQRAVFKSSPDAQKVEALNFNWSPVKKYFGADSNASFEGIAIAGDRLYLANERSAARIIVIDLPSRRVVDSFFVDSAGFAFGGPHYTDLAFVEGRLFILNRNHRCIFEVDPETKRVLAEYSFAQMELGEEVAYKSDYPTGAMEGLAIDAEYFWLLTDNNGKARFKYPKDIRPTLFRAQRPKGTITLPE